MVALDEEGLLTFIYPQLNQLCPNDFDQGQRRQRLETETYGKFFLDRCLLCAKNDDVDAANSRLLDMFHG